MSARARGRVTSPFSITNLTLTAKKYPRHSDVSFMLHAQKPAGSFLEVFDIVFDPATGCSSLRPENGGVRARSSILEYSSEIASVIRFHESMCRLMSFDPQSVGFHFSKKAAPFSPWRTSEDFSLFDDLATCGVDFSIETDEIISPSLLRLIPEEKRVLGYYWHAGTEAPIEFGSPYLVPVVDLGNEDEEPVEGWQVRLNGLEEREPVAFAMARWDDREGIERLVEQVKSIAPSAALSLAALSANNHERAEIRISRMEFDRKLQRPLALEAWDSSRALRPVLVTRAIKEAEREFSDPASSTRRRSSDHPPFWYNSIRTDTIFWGMNGPAKNQEVARRIFRVQRDAPAVSLRTAGEAIQAQLNERNLGQVVLAQDSHNEEMLLIAKDAEYLSEYHTLFGVPDRSTIQPIVPAG